MQAVHAREHSPVMISPAGRQAPSQYCSQRQQSPQVSTVLPQTPGVKQLRRPKSTPRGQAKRQKNRGKKEIQTHHPQKHDPDEPRTEA